LEDERISIASKSLLGNQMCSAGRCDYKFSMGKMRINLLSYKEIFARALC
jgi:hypothetical protein